MPSPRTRDPDRYTTSSLQGRAWDALGSAQAQIRRTTGTEPNKSDTLVALAAVAANHPDELAAALEGK